ncbi:hypothetical protein GCM10008098_20800 [Rhodanobacter panaciterrae]|uniref:Uncharacterized protein n=1 Tax=Rhodanobacter panaciterrae TaxID=490572 RepID=A0ABQ2ZWC7_9GAMM|nr:hypothetical protein GCM10008098_20800 [Rhodanobacter panaciterrae]
MVWAGKEIKSDPTPALPCAQGREHSFFAGVLQGKGVKLFAKTHHSTPGPGNSCVARNVAMSPFNAGSTNWIARVLSGT